MPTLNADAYPLMKRMHKPDPKVAPDRQDKRSLVLLEAQDFETWLGGSLEQAKTLIRLTPVDIFDAELRRKRRKHACYEVGCFGCASSQLVRCRTMAHSRMEYPPLLWVAVQNRWAYRQRPTETAHRAVYVFSISGLKEYS